MVQILPQPTSLGTSLGQNLGQGLGQGIQQGANVGFQRNLLQGALGNIKPGQTPLETTKNFLTAIAGIPGSERYAAQLLPMVLGQARTEELYGKNGAGPSTSFSEPGQPQQVQPQQQGQVPQASELGVAQTPAQQPQFGGFLPRIRTQDEIERFAQDYARQHMDPSKFQEGLGQATALNAQAQGSQDLIRQRASSELKIPQNELPEFMQIAQRYGHLKNPDELLTSANRDFQQYRNLKTTLDKAFFPGVGIGAAKTLGEIGAPFLAHFINKSEDREKAINRLQPTVRKLLDLGFEPQVRQKLASESLSPTEVEEVIHPLSKETSQKISSFPLASKIPQNKRQEHLSNFFKSNVDKDTSLLVLRHKLWNDKDYNWEEIGPAIREAQTKGLKLTPAQETEMAEVESQAPRQSLGDIFQGWGRWIDYVRGNK